MKEDQEAAVSNLLKTSREFEKMLNDKDVVSKDQVIAHMMQNWEMNKANNQQLAGECQTQCSIMCMCYVVTVLFKMFVSISDDMITTYICNLNLTCNDPLTHANTGYSSVELKLSNVFNVYYVALP